MFFTTLCKPFSDPLFYPTVINSDETNVTPTLTDLVFFQSFLQQEFWWNVQFQNGNIPFFKLKDRSHQEDLNLVQQEFWWNAQFSNGNIPFFQVKKTESHQEEDFFLNLLDFWITQIQQSAAS